MSITSFFIKVFVIFTTLALVFLVNKSTAQTDTTVEKPAIAKNTVFVEGLGNGIIGSVNYDRLILTDKNKFSFRMGFVYLPINHVSSYAFPIEFNFLKGKKNHLEFGAGITYAHGFNTDVNDNPYSGLTVIISKAIYANAHIGYRFQKETGGVFAKVSGLIFYKSLELNKNYVQRKNEFIFGPYIGLSLGYTFKNKKS